MEKYKIKENEAEAFKDFMMPMLEYYPERRATAQEMLSHYWLDMPADFEFQMSEREYEKMLMFKKNLRNEIKEVYGKNDLIESDNEVNMGDDEDNLDGLDNNYESEDSHPDPTEIINIQNFNNSFAAYGQHVKLSALDRANPQFK